MDHRKGYDGYPQHNWDYTQDTLYDVIAHLEISLCEGQIKGPCNSRPLYVPFGLLFQPRLVGGEVQLKRAEDKIVQFA